MASRLQQPLDSSKSPMIGTCTAEGSSQRNHRFRKLITIRNTMTHPQTVAVTVSAGNMASVIFVGLAGDTEPNVTSEENSNETRYALNIWMNQSIQGIQASGNMAAVIPKRKAGPALLQKVSRRCAVSF